MTDWDPYTAPGHCGLVVRRTMNGGLLIEVTDQTGVRMLLPVGDGGILTWRAVTPDDVMKVSVITILNGVPRWPDDVE